MTKLSDITLNASPLNADYLVMVHDPSGSPVTRRTQIENYRQYVLLYDETLVSSSHFEITGIDQGYEDLILLLSLRSDVAATTDGTHIYFNNDQTETNYHATRHYTLNGTTHGVVEYTEPVLWSTAGNTAPANSFSFAEVYIPHYSSASRFKHQRNIMTGLYSAGAVALNHSGATWDAGGTAAITRIDIAADDHSTNKLAANSRARLIGVKHAS